MLRIHCFGDFQLEFGNKIISNFETENTRALFAYLAVESARPLRRSHLAGLLWSDEPEKRALHNLRQTLSRLRKTMGAAFSAEEYLLVDRECLQLNPNAPVWVDAAAFGNAYHQAYRFYQSQEGRGLINYRWLRRAVDLQPAQFLAQFSLGKSTLFEEWVLLMREKFNLQLIKALADLSDYYERRAEYHLALKTTNQLVELAPWDEVARGKLMNLYGVTQQWHAAASQYAALCAYLSDQFDIEPSAEVIRLHRQIQQAAVDKTSIQPRYVPLSNTLPEEMIPFIGRENELDQLMEMVVDPQIRLISVVGTGGIGKTSLSIHLAHHVIGGFSGGVFFAACLPVQNPDQLLQLIGDVSGLIFNDQAEPKKQLIDHLYQKETLLILDNFEHLVSNLENINLVDELLAKSTNLTILVTSREKLLVRQEHCYNLSGLNCPSEDRIGLQEAENFDAVSLFVERMRQFNPTFQLNEENYMAVIQLCRILDGLPLGIELAAASVWEQGLDVITQRIQQDLGILTAKLHNTLPRHRNLQVVFDVSWFLLTPTERTILANLSIFRDGFDRISAEQVALADPAVLSALVSKSLVRIKNDVRFDLHEMIRHFAAEKRKAAGKSGEVQSRHARYFISFLAEKEKHILGHQQAAVLAAIQLELSNLDRMWKELVEQQLFTELLTGVNSLYQFFVTRSLSREGLEWFQYALKNLPEDAAFERSRGILLSRLGALAYQARQRGLALDSLLHGQQLLQQHEDLSNVAFCNLQLGWVHWQINQLNRAESFAQQAVANYQALQEDLGIGEALFLWGNIRQKQSKNPEAKEYFDQALVLCRRTGNQRLLSLILNRLSDLACYEGQYEIAAAQFKECLQISQQLDDRYSQAVLLNNLGTIYHVWKEYPKAHHFYQQSLILCREIGDMQGAALALNNLGEIATALGHYSNAIKYAHEALQIAEQYDETWTKIVCLNSLGEHYLAMEQYENSQNTLRRSLRLAIDSQGWDQVARIAINLGRVFQLQGDHFNAVRLLQAAVAHSSTAHELREKATAWLSEMKADGLSNQGDHLLTEVVCQIV